jgi:hypothetical protein
VRIPPAATAPPPRHAGARPISASSRAVGSVGQNHRTVGSQSAPIGTPPRRRIDNTGQYLKALYGWGPASVLKHTEAETLRNRPQAGGGRFRGIRFITASHPEQAAWGSAVIRPAGLLMNPKLREGLQSQPTPRLTLPAAARAMINLPLTGVATAGRCRIGKRELVIAVGVVLVLP